MLQSSEIKALFVHLSLCHKSFHFFMQYNCISHIKSLPCCFFLLFSLYFALYFAYRVTLLTLYGILRCHLLMVFPKGISMLITFTYFWNEWMHCDVTMTSLSSPYDAIRLHINPFYKSFVGNMVRFCHHYRHAFHAINHCRAIIPINHRHARPCHQ